MPSPPIQIFLTTIASQPALRRRQELLLRILQVKKIPYTSYDLASDEEAKKLWRRKVPANEQQLPGILVGGRFPGPFAEFEDAVEHDELAIFLRLNEPYDPAVEEDRPLLASRPVGVPGALTPSESTPLHHAKYSPSPSRSPSTMPGEKLRIVNKEESIDVGDELSGFGLQGVKVTEDDLRELMGELGLEGDEAEGLVKGLSGGDIHEKPKVKEVSKAEAPKPAPATKVSKVDKVEKKEQPDAKGHEALVAELGVKLKAGPHSKASESKPSAPPKSESTAKADSAAGPPEAEARKSTKLEAKEPTEAEAKEPTEAEAREPTEAEAREPTEAEAREPTEAEAREPTEAEAKESAGAEARESTQAEGKEFPAAEAKISSEAEANESTGVEGKESAQVKGEGSPEAETKDYTKSEAKDSTDAKGKESTEAEAKEPTEAKRQGSPKAEIEIKLSDETSTEVSKDSKAGDTAD